MKPTWTRAKNGAWLLSGTAFSVYRDKADGRWDVCEGDGYLCTTRYINKAKYICQRLAASPITSQMAEG